MGGGVWVQKCSLSAYHSTTSGRKCRIKYGAACSMCLLLMLPTCQEKCACTRVKGRWSPFERFI